MRLRRKKPPKAEAAPAQPPSAAPAQAGQPTPATPATAAQPAAPGQPPAPTQPAAPGQPAAAAQPAATAQQPITASRKPITGAQPTTAPTPAQQIESMRAWTAQLDRRLGIRTYIFAALLVLSIAASVLAIVLAVDARDNSASDDDLNSIESQLATIAEGSSDGAEVQAELDSIDARLSTLESEESDTAATGGVDEKRITVIEDDIDDLRQQISDLNGGSGGGSSP